MLERDPTSDSYTIYERVGRFADVYFYTIRACVLRNGVAKYVEHE